MTNIRHNFPEVISSNCLQIWLINQPRLKCKAKIYWWPSPLIDSFALFTIERLREEARTWYCGSSAQSLLYRLWLWSTPLPQHCSACIQNVLALLLYTYGEALFIFIYVSDSNNQLPNSTSWCLQLTGCSTLCWHHITSSQEQKINQLASFLKQETVIPFVPLLPGDLAHHRVKQWLFLFCFYS